MPSPETKPITLSPEVSSEIEQIVAHSQTFSSVEQYVNFVLEALLFDGSERDSPQEQQQVRERLKALGYL